MSAPQVAVGAVAVRDGHILLVRRGHGPAAGTWSVPGGRVRPGETLHEAVVREVAEETALEVVVDHFLGWVERIGDSPTDPHFVILDFEVSLLEGVRPPTAGDDAAEAAWVELDQLDDLTMAPGLLEFLEDTGVRAGGGPGSPSRAAAAPPPGCR